MCKAFRRQLPLSCIWILLQALAWPACAAPVTQLKVLTFNIWRQGGLSLTNCTEAIRASGADLVGLQECNQATARIIATNLGFDVMPAGDSSIVTRYPIVSTYLAGNGCGVTVQLSPTQRAHHFNCHLAAYPYGPYDLKNGQSTSYILDAENSVRMPEMKQVLKALQPCISGSEPCFLTGDFNAPSHLDYAALPWPTSLACVQAGFTDSYRELHAGNRTYPGAFLYNDPGITWTPKTSEEANGVFDRIDFVYYTPQRGVSAIASQELDERNSVNPWPSDHRAVLSTFQLTPPATCDKAAAPTPADSSTSLPVSFNLLWRPGNNATNHALHIGTNNAQLRLATNTTTAVFALTNLVPGATYFWRVDEVSPSGTVTGDVWSFTTATASVYEWNFAAGSLAPSLGRGVFSCADGVATSNLTTFGITDGTQVPHIDGVPAAFLRAPAFADNANGYLLTFTDSPANGGGQYLNQYTLILDVLLPSPLGWSAILNTSTANANDADLYIGANGSFGIGAIGYSAAGAIKADTWQRIAVAADLAAGTVSYYVNGALVRAGSAGLDSRFSLFSNLDPGADLLLFNEGDSSGVFTHVIYLNSLCFVDRTLTAAEMLGLGGPKARGIFAGSTPLRFSIDKTSDTFTLSWTGGVGPFQLQRSLSLAADASWENCGTAGFDRTATLSGNSGNAFFRLVDQGR